MRGFTSILPVLLALTVAVSGASLGGLAHGAPYTVNVAMTTVQGKSEQILTDAEGLTLYYVTSDSPTSPACTGACIKAWPPLLSSTIPTGPAALPGKLAVVLAANGSQVSYNDHLLYRYAADTNPGQVSGNNLVGPGGGKWYVATSTIPAVRSGGAGDNDRGGGNMGSGY